MPTLNAREHGGQNQQAAMLDSHQQDGRFKVSNHPEVSNTLTSHMGTGRADHIPVMTSNGDDVFPALCATDGSKRFIDNQSINGGRLLIDRRRT